MKVTSTTVDAKTIFSRLFSSSWLFPGHCRDHLKTEMIDDINQKRCTITRSSTASTDSASHADTKTHAHANSLELPRTSPTRQQNIYIRRLRKTTILTLVTTSPLVLAVAAFLSFLWYSDTSNTTWHTIMLRGWATRLVTVSSLLVRTAVDFQGGVAAAMLGALILESGSPALRHAPLISTARAGKPKPRTLLFPV